MDVGEHEYDIRIVTDDSTRIRLRGSRLHAIEELSRRIVGEYDDLRLARVLLDRIRDDPAVLRDLSC